MGDIVETLWRHEVFGQMAFRIKDLEKYGFKTQYDAKKEIYTIEKVKAPYDSAIVFPYGEVYYNQLKSREKGFPSLEGKAVFVTNEFASPGGQVYKIENEPVVFAKNLIRFGYIENNNRFEVYYNSYYMVDDFYNDQIFKYKGLFQENNGRYFCNQYKYK